MEVIFAICTRNNSLGRFFRPFFDLSCLVGPHFLLGSWFKFAEFLYPFICPRHVFYRWTWSARRFSGLLLAITGFPHSCLRKPSNFQRHFYYRTRSRDLKIGTHTLLYSSLLGRQRRKTGKADDQLHQYQEHGGRRAGGAVHAPLNDKKAGSGAKSRCKQVG